MFPTGVRYTGTFVVYQPAATPGAGFTPLTAIRLLNLGGGNNIFVAVLFSAAFVIAGVCVCMPKNTRLATDF